MFASYIDSVGDTIYGDVHPEELVEFHYRVLGFSDVPYGRLRDSAFGGEYVYREARRVLESVSPAGTPVYAGIDIDIPIQAEDLRKQAPVPRATSTRESVRESVRQALRAGVQGLVISRKYSEMRLDSLSGVGEAVREFER